MLYETDCFVAPLSRGGQGVVDLSHSPGTHGSCPQSGGLLVSRTTRRRSAVLGALVAVLVATGSSVAAAGDAVATAPGAPAPVAPQAVVPALTWAGCGTTDVGTTAHVQCATAGLPMDYDQPQGAAVHIAVAKVPATDPAHRIGSLFFVVGGPGRGSVDYLQSAGAGIFANLNQRFDLIGFDPRGVGQSTPSIDCKANQETQGIYSQPVPTPLDVDVHATVARAQSYVDLCLANNGEILRHISTANVARDMDALRAAVGEEQLTYFGFSYGTFLGSTYASLFPQRYRAMVLDGPVDAQAYIHDPISNIAQQTAGIERALDRFFRACAADQVACASFGGADPGAAYDRLVASAETTPIPAPAYTPDPRPVTGDDSRLATSSLLYSKQSWGPLAQFLAQAQQGDASTFRAFVDLNNYGRNVDGTFSPSTDRYFTIGATEQEYPQGNIRTFLNRGAESWASFPHFWFNSGYAEIAYALWPAHDEDAYGGPFTIPASSPPPLVVATTYDPATPYPGAQQLVRELGNARLLTMDGDGHTAYGGKSACVDTAAQNYLFTGALPARGTVCPQQTPFAAPQPAPAGGAASVGALVGASPAVGRR